MKNKLILKLILFVLLLASNSSAQQIMYMKFKDGVEKYYRVQQQNEKPWFYKQLEEVFNVIVQSNSDLPFDKSIAFLVGVSEYTYISPDLKFVKNDLNDMKDFLLNKGGFDEVYVAKEKIVNSPLVEQYLKRDIKVTENDRLLFYYAGHGDDYSGDTGYMQFANARKGEFFGDQVLKIKDAETWCSELTAKHQLFIFDCCASGLAFRSRTGSFDAQKQIIATLSKNGSRAVLTAGTKDEKAYEKDGNGVFTRSFINSIEKGWADKGEGKDGFVTIEEVFADVKSSISQYSTPRIWTLQERMYKGSFIFINPTAKSQNIILKRDYSIPLQATPRGTVVASYGIIRLVSYLTGSIYIDGVLVGNVTSGDMVDYSNISEGKHIVVVRGSDQKITKVLDVKKGVFNLIDIYPEKLEPLNENLKIEQKESLLRSSPVQLSKENVKNMLVLFNYYCRERS